MKSIRLDLLEEVLDVVSLGSGTSQDAEWLGICLGQW